MHANSRSYSTYIYVYSLMTLGFPGVPSLRDDDVRQKRSIEHDPGIESPPTPQVHRRDAIDGALVENEPIVVTQQCAPLSREEAWILPRW